MTVRLAVLLAFGFGTLLFGADAQAQAVSERWESPAFVLQAIYWSALTGLFFLGYSMGARE